MPAAFDALASAYVSSNTSSVNFSSISQAYDDLCFIFAGKSNDWQTQGRELTVKFNNNSNNYYFSSGVNKNGASISYLSGGYQNAARLGKCVSSRGSYNWYPNNYGVCELWLNDYTSTKTASGLFISGCHPDSPSSTSCHAALGGLSTTDNFTSAITQVTFAMSGGYSFEAGSKFWMYGLKSS
jgi:hypothetical protein